MDHKEERFIFIHVKIKRGEWQGTKQLVVFPKSISIVHLDQPLYIITLSITPRYIISCLSLILTSFLCNFSCHNLSYPLPQLNSKNMFQSSFVKLFVQQTYGVNSFLHAHTWSLMKMLMNGMECKPYMCLGMNLMKINIVTEGRVWSQCAKKDCVLGE